MELFRLSHIFLVIVTKYVKYWQIRVFNRNTVGTSSSRVWQSIGLNTLYAVIVYGLQEE